MQSKQFKWRARDIRNVAGDAVTITFDAPAFRYSAGQFINATLEIGGEPVTRSYSLSSLYGEDTYPQITVKRILNGKMSNYLLDKVTTKEEWNIEGPFGNFTADRAEEGRAVVFLAGGSGITPVMPLARQMVRAGNRATLLINAIRDIQSTLFYEEIRRLGTRGLKLVFACSQTTSALGTDNFLQGRLNKLLVKKIIKNHLPEDWQTASYFICGPDGLMAVYKQALSDMGIPGEKIHSENFNSEDDPEPVTSLPEKALEILLHYNERTSLLEVHPRQTILNAAHMDRVPVPASCKTGTCGTCYGKILSGQVHLIRNAALSEAELIEGYTLLCQAYPLSEDVEIEIIR